MNRQIEKVKNHLNENKKIYVASGIGLVVGATAVFIYMRSNGSSNVAKQKVIAWKTGNITQNVVQTNLARRGHPGNMILCNETGEVFASQNRAASVLGINASELSKHVRGLLPSAGGYTFEKLGEAQ